MLMAQLAQVIPVTGIWMFLGSAIDGVPDVSSLRGLEYFV
jgi:hypothetical protein